MAIVLGLDPSLTNTGIAILKGGVPHRFHSIGHGGRNGATYAERSDRIVSQARAVTNWVLNDGLIRQVHYDLVVMEGPAYGQNLPSNHDRAGLWWGLFSAFRARKVPVVVIAPKTRAMWATGNGNADKKLVLETVRSWWPTTKIVNHDIADAAALATIGAAHCGDPIPFELRDRHKLKLDEIIWPAMEGTAV